MVRTAQAIAPQVTKVLILFNPNAALQPVYLEPLKTKAPNFGFEAIEARVLTTADIESALSRGSEGGGVWGFVALPDPYLFNYRQLICDLAARYRVPAVYPLRAFATSGGLISYGADFLDLWKRAANYIDRILKGEKPGELPVHTPVKFETVVNFKAAKALGLEMPAAVLAQADEVIE